MTLENIKKHVGKEFAGDVDFIDMCIKQLDLPKDAEILDVGTGLGIMSSVLGLNGYEVLTGEPENYSYGEDSHHHEEFNDEHERDFDHESLDWRDTVNIAGVKDMVDFQFLNVMILEFDDNEFDAVFLYDILQHLSGPVKYVRAISESLRVVQKGGIVCIIEMKMETVEQWNREFNYGFKFIDPRDHMDTNAVNIKLIEGPTSTMYVISKK